MKIRREPGLPLSGRLTYLESEYSFVFDVADRSDLVEYAGESGFTSITIGTLQIEIGIESRRALYVWGYHPKLSWVQALLEPPIVERQAVLLASDKPTLQVGVSIAVAPVGAWRTTHDRSNGWVRVAPDDVSDDWLTEIAEGTVLGCLHGDLHSVWLLPKVVR